MTDPTSLRVGMVGYAFMGAAHSHAWRTAPRFFDLPLRPELAAVAGRNADGVRAAAAKMGWASRRRTGGRWSSGTTSTSSTSARPATPTPRSPSRRSGPASTCSARSRSRTALPRPSRCAAADGAGRGVFAMCGYTYRRDPGARARPAHRRRRPAREDPPRAGTVPAGLAVERTRPLTWRLDKAKRGPAPSATSGRTASTPPSSSPVRASPACRPSLETFVTGTPAGRRPWAWAGTAPGRRRAGPVTVDDAVIFTARFREHLTAKILRPHRHLRGKPGGARPEERQAPRE